MTIAVVGTPVEGSLNATGITTVDATAFTPQAGSTLLAIVSYSHGSAAQSASLSDVTGSNDSWAEAESGIFNSLNGLRAFVLSSAAAVSTTVRATFGAAVNYPTVWVLELSGANTTTPFLDAAFNAVSNPGTGANAITSGALATLASAPAMVVGLTYDINGLNVPPVAGTGFTTLPTLWTYQGAVSAGAGRAEYQRVTATTGIAATFTAQTGAEGSTYLSVVVAIAEAAGGGGGSAILRQMMAHHGG